jgi:hypothetical protein
MVDNIEILVTNRIAIYAIKQVWSTTNTCLNWRLLWMDTRILAVGFCIAGIMVRRFKTRFTMQFTNKWKYNTIMLDRKSIIWQLFG